MTTPKTSKNHWQNERAKLLHRACLSLQAAIQSGQPVCKTLRRISRRYHGRSFRSDAAGRTLRLSPLTLRRQWNAWRRGGQVPSAIRLGYRTPSNTRLIPAPILIRFMEFYASRRFPNLTVAWKQFVARGNRHGRGRGLSIEQVRRQLPVAAFYQIQHTLREIEAEQIKLARLRLQITADLRRRLPDRVNPARTRKEIFEI